MEEDRTAAPVPQSSRSDAGTAVQWAVGGGLVMVALIVGAIGMEVAAGIGATIHPAALIQTVTQPAPATHLDGAVYGNEVPGAEAVRIRPGAWVVYAGCAGPGRGRAGAYVREGNVWALNTEQICRMNLLVRRLTTPKHAQSTRWICAWAPANGRDPRPLAAPTCRSSSRVAGNGIRPGYTAPHQPFEPDGAVFFTAATLSGSV